MKSKSATAAQSALTRRSNDRQIRSGNFFYRLFPLSVLLLLLAILPSGASGDTGAGWLPDSDCNLDAPAVFEAQGTGSGSAWLSWSAVSGAVSYRLKVYELRTNNLHSSTVISGTSHELTGLSEGESYRCTLAAICSGGSTSDFIIWVDVLD